MLNKLFKSKKESELMLKKETLYKKINKIENKIKEQEKILSKKNETIRENEKNKEENWQEIEIKLKKYYKENEELREILKKGEKIISKNSLKYNYLVPIEKYLFEAKAKELVIVLKNKGNNYVQDLNEYIIKYLSIEENLKLYLIKKFEKFKRFDISWEVKTYLINGEEISKVYTKNRKLINILYNENKKFMSELEEYDFKKLTNNGYSLEEIENFERVFQDYISKFRIEVF